jgi:PRMT5 arginine-N-methyltransferase
MLISPFVPLAKPLMNNLQSSTYESFERDPVKYKNYEDVGAFYFTSWDSRIFNWIG